MVWDDVIYTPGTLKVICYKNGKEWATEEIKTTGTAEKLSLSVDRSVIAADGTDFAFITVSVSDKEGLTVPRSNQLIRFSIEGAGEIVATDNGDATSFVPFQSHERQAFNGLVLVIVKAKKGQKGQFTVKAESEGLSLGTIVVKAE